MKKNNYIRQYILLTLVLFGQAACQQNEMVEDSLLKQMQFSAPMVSRSISCEITTTKPGQLDSLLAVKAKEGGYQASNLSSLTISGPIMQKDIDCIKYFRYLQTLDLTNAKIFNNGFYFDEVLYPAEEINGIPSDMFSHSNFHEVLLPGHITYIENKAFANSEITSIIIPDSVSKIGDYAFNECDALTEVKLPSTLLSIGEYAFGWCHYLTKINFPKGLKVIDENAFISTGLTEINIPESVTSIGDCAFEFCDVTSVTINGNPSMGKDVFAQCENLQEVKVVGNLSSLPDWTFSSCINLRKVEISGSIRSIGNRAFYHCTSLQEISFPEGLEEVDDLVFDCCSSLQRILLPEGVNKIGKSAFENCSALTTLTIPSTVTSCGEAIFGYCPKLTSVFWNASIDIPRLCSIEDSWYGSSNLNENLLVYAKENVSSDSENKNVIYDRHAAYITLNRNQPFNCPQRFTTDSITYTMSFPTKLQAELDTNGNWKSIALPFTVTSIVQKDNQRAIAPFNADVEGASPFWLRELTADGFANATRIEANKGYIISMPNSEKYEVQYNITGDVIFSASGNVEVPATEPIVSVGPAYSLNPAFAVVPKTGKAWGLNEEEYVNPIDGKVYGIGSVFVASKRIIRPFEAYLTSNASTRTVWSVASCLAQTRSVQVVGPIPSINDK